MVQTEATIIHKETITPAWWRLTLSAPDLSPAPLPGQFLLARCGDLFTCYLRRPIFPQPLADHHFSLLLRPDADPGLAWLAARQVGDPLDIIGPLGQGFNLPSTVQNLLLISDSQMIAPLLGQMERAIAAGLSITLALGGSRSSTLYPVASLPPAVEYQVAALDGSLGHHGPITNLLPDLLRWADLVCAVGSVSLYQAIKRQTQTIRFAAQAGFMYGLIVNSLFACGVGACFGCALTTTIGSQLTCSDGPVFDLAELIIEEIADD
jgi:dihydroorotate dehydrogenase electron transfer subunit